MKNDNREGQEKSTPQPRCSICGSTRNDSGACSFIECRAPLFDVEWDKLGLSPFRTYTLPDEADFPHIHVDPLKLAKEAFRAGVRSVAGGEPPEDRGSDAVKACLRFIRQCVSGKCDELDLEVIRGEIDGVLRVAGGEPEQPAPNENMLEYWLRDYAQFRPNWLPLIEEYLKSLPAPPQGKEQK